MSILSEEERKHHLGVPLPDQQTIARIELEGRAMREAARIRAVGAPAAFDWRNVNGQNYVSQIRDQGRCGSCVAFGACATIETTFRVQRGNPGLAVDLSEAHLFHCQARAQGYNCSIGWWPELALNSARDTGIADEVCYPYTDVDQNCTNLCGDWQNRVTKISAHHSLVSNAAGMKEWVSSRGALSACFIVYNDFYSYSGGVYRHVWGDQAGGHCVSIVGYDDGQGCWICKNSWGTGWGESGFFRIAYGDSGIDTWDVRAVDGIVETGWLNNTRVLGLWTIDQDRNAWVYLDNVGWRRIAFDNDNIFLDMLVQLVAAKSANRPVNVYQENSIITQIYVL
jgi:C1A family cysteine protease